MFHLCDFMHSSLGDMLPQTGAQESVAKEGSSQKKPPKKRSTKSKDCSQATVSSRGQWVLNVYDKEGNVHNIF